MSWVSICASKGCCGSFFATLGVCKLEKEEKNVIGHLSLSELDNLKYKEQGDFTKGGFLLRKSERGGYFYFPEVAYRNNKRVLIITI